MVDDYTITFINKKEVVKQLKVLFAIMYIPVIDWIKVSKSSCHVFEFELWFFSKSKIQKMKPSKIITMF
jgi:hypothetical protein